MKFQYLVSAHYTRHNCKAFLIRLIEASSIEEAFLSDKAKRLFSDLGELEADDCEIRVENLTLKNIDLTKEQPTQY